MSLLLLPQPLAPFVGPGGRISPEWYRYLQAVEERTTGSADTVPELAAAIEGICRALGSPDGTVANIPEDLRGITQVIGAYSVRAYQDGDSLVRVQLEGDEVSPAAGTAYGMVSDGVKGWRDVVFSVNDATGTVILWNVETVSGMGHTLAQEDRDKLLRFTNDSAKTLIIEAEADTPIVQDTRVHIRNVGTADLTIAPDMGVTVNGDTLVLAQNATASLIRVAEDEWDLVPYFFAEPDAVESVNGRTGAVVLTAADTPATVTVESGTTHSLVATDAGLYLRFTNSGTKTLTVQDNADEAIAVGVEIHGRNAGTGDLTIAEDTAVTVNPPAGGTLVVPQGGTFTLKKIATDEWDLFGVTVAP